MDLVFVILHYCSVNDTLDCVNSIKSNMNTAAYRIIIVDNHSPDDSYAILENEYKDDINIRLVSTSCNLGFAKGNNVGIEIARNEFNPEFIAVMNNDICILQKNPDNIIKNIYMNTPFAVMGPMVLTNDGRYDSNPKGNHILSKDETYRAIKRAKRILTFNRFSLGSAYLKLETLKNNLRKSNKSHGYKKHTQLQHGHILHGCFLVFSREYFKYFKGFDDRTFLYMEEEILYKHVCDKNLEMIYSPELIVFHKEDASTNSLYKKSKEKLDFVIKNNIDSYGKYLEMFEDEK